MPPCGAAAPAVRRACWPVAAALALIFAGIPLTPQLPCWATPAATLAAAPAGRTRIVVSAFGRGGLAGRKKLTTRRVLEAEELQTLKEGAETGDIESQYILGKLYSDGEEGVEKDLDQAAMWLSKAAESGLAEAQYSLAMMYMLGDGVEEDGKEGVAWLEKAATGGMPMAQLYYAQILLQGELVKANKGRAMEMLSGAAEQDNIDAQYILGTLLMETPAEATEEKQWAAHWLTKAAEKQDPRAQFQIGRMFLGGIGMEADAVKASNWMSASANTGYRDAQYMMGTMLLSGLGVDKNPEWASYWFTEAAKQGQVDAQYNLALMLEAGDGIPADKEKAIYWLEQAVAKGDRDSAQLLDELRDS